MEKYHSSLLLYSLHGTRSFIIRCSLSAISLIDPVEVVLDLILLGAKCGFN